MTLLSTVLAFDLGASSGRALIGELIQIGDEEPKLQVKEIHRFPNQPIQIGKHLHWDILRLLHEIKTGIRIAFQEGYKPLTLGIDTWGVDFGLIDANGELVGNPYHYRDAQTEGLIEEVNGLIGKEALFKQSGLQFMPFNTIYQLYAMRKASSPKLDIAQTLLLTSDLLIYFLTGKKVCEFTMATTTQLLNLENQTWNVELMDRLGIPSRLFLEPVAPGTRIAPLSPEVYEELGVQSIEAVAVGTHDTESAIVAVPASSEPFAYLVCGTWSLLGTELAEPLLTPETMELEFSNEGGVGGTYQLLKNIMGLWILQECKREWDERGNVISFADLAKLAEEAEPLRSFIQPDDPRFYSPSGMVEKVRSYCKETNQPIPQSEGQVARCILEGLALRYRQALEQAEKLTGQSFSGLHMVGGGIQNELLCRLTAGALGRPVWAGPVEASAIGNMLMQLVSLRQCKDLAAARKLTATSFPVQSYQAESTDLWDQAYKKFIQLRPA
ncbi:carbohydrate kinase [Paenibacillus baekrokdamisoli]|uniref:Carbohydrate kinase n=1 Tax=Paenibacillus baekrokdamisoli TaxID=1712516 RepID=A0A3G9IL82_9BACL|nr:rhamnulokinase family protein [Paenibacillus baekrokdamisoli]MBB3067731.1 rhamnulokinase [Paenibacillus baekrokdamisoli]BBH19086.1 carbohydrate kinase [Paenibacillus baekrokdamisoli]